MRKPRGYVLWEGPSEIDGEPVVLIATYGSRSSPNRKTGEMIQTYILRADMSPTEATNTGQDRSICGDCIHRKGNGGTCYVRVEQGPLKVYKAYKRGTYQHRLQPGMFSGGYVRLGAYGDPAAIPLRVLTAVLTGTKGHTGYTHQWRKAEYLKDWCMASCDTPRETAEAQALGWRTFSVVSSSEVETWPTRSFLCPASHEAGKSLTCIDCMACGGLRSSNKAPVFIPVHGVDFKKERFNRLIQISHALNHP